MDSYFPVILLINLTLLLNMGILVSKSGTIENRVRRAFRNVFLLTAFISVSEFLAFLIDGIPGLRGLSIAINAVGFMLPPLLPLTIARTLDENKRPMRWYCLVPVAVNCIAVLCGGIFRVDENNVYSRESCYWIYVAAYQLGVMYLFINSTLFSRKNQHYNVSVFLMIGVFLLVSTSIQIFLPYLHLSWLCATITWMLYYSFFTDLLHQRDALTGLLNRRSLERHLEREGGQVSGVVMLDINGFKKINDTYGHPAGDRCLKTFGEALKTACGSEGLCYRYGGDEFCILLRRGKHAPAEMLERRLKERLAECSCLPCSLSASMGYASLEETGDPAQALALADRRMYASKPRGKDDPSQH